VIPAWAWAAAGAGIGAWSGLTAFWLYRIASWLRRIFWVLVVSGGGPRDQ
jgi:hypothetical protein